MRVKRFLVALIVVGCSFAVIGYMVAGVNHSSRVWPLILGFGPAGAAALFLRDTKKGP